MKKIDQFIRTLSHQKVSTGSTNLYAGRSKVSIIRKENLRRYLYQMSEADPSVLLLGEAPGYKGCGLTGIPFTSERILTENEYFQNLEYQCFNQPAMLQSEISATIVWDELNSYPIKPLIWNIYPFHPHTDAKKNTNRTPTTGELEIGAGFLSSLLEIFSIDKIIAVGRKPAIALEKHGYDHTCIRHPARGGKHQFISGLRKELK